VVFQEVQRNIKTILWLLIKRKHIDATRFNYILYIHIVHYLELLRLH